KVRGI
ncbi:tetratricopeptide repeat family protein, partial [Vibrio harveyi]